MAKAAGKKIAVDFGDTESRGGKKGERSSHVPPADYLVKCIKAEIVKSSEKKTPGIRVVYQIVQGKHKGKKLIDNLWLSEGALWRLRQTLEGMGIKVPSKRVNFDPASMKGKQVGITVEDEEYEDKVRSRVVDSFLPSEMEDEAADLDEDEDDVEDEDDEDDSDDDDEDEDEDDDLEEMDLDL